MSYIIPIRKGEELNEQRLELYLRNEFNDIPNGPLSIKQFGTGASNLTYALSVGEWEAVLRRAPVGPLAHKAHDIERESKILSVLSANLTMVPKPYVFCNDSSIVGKPFLLMERKKGVLIDTEFPEGTENTEIPGREISELMVDTLVDLHSIPYKGTVLEQISKPKGFLERQVHGWIKRFKKASTEELKEIDFLSQWLPKYLPEQSEYSIIHYDYKLDNALFSEDLSKINGLFDWEMSTVGDPLVDLAVAMTYWIEKDDIQELKDSFPKRSITVNNGFYTRKEFIERYSKKSGRDVKNINYYMTFAYFKLAGICQQIYYRYKNGQTNDERFKKFGDYALVFLRESYRLAINDGE